MGYWAQPNSRPVLSGNWRVSWWVFNWIFKIPSLVSNHPQTAILLTWELDGWKITQENPPKHSFALVYVFGTYPLGKPQEFYEKPRAFRRKWSMDPWWSMSGRRWNLSQRWSPVLCSKMEGGTPKSSLVIGFSTLNQHFGDPPFMETSSHEEFKSPAMAGQSADGFKRLCHGCPTR